MRYQINSLPKFFCGDGPQMSLHNDTGGVYEKSGRKRYYTDVGRYETLFVERNIVSEASLTHERCGFCPGLPVVDTQHHHVGGK